MLLFTSVTASLGLIGKVDVALHSQNSKVRKGELMLLFIYGLDLTVH